MCRMLATLRISAALRPGQAMLFSWAWVGARGGGAVGGSNRAQLGAWESVRQTKERQIIKTIITIIARFQSED